MKRIRIILALIAAVVILGAVVYTVILACQIVPVVMRGGPFPLKWWAIPSAATVLLVVAACLVRRLWHRQIMLAVAVSFVIPVPVFAPGGGAVVPLGIFLMSFDAFPKSILLLGIPSLALFGMFWTIGRSIRFVRGRMKETVQPALAE